MTSSSSSPSSSAAAAAAASKQPSTKPFIPSASSATATTTSGGGSLYRNLEKKAEEINLVLLQPTVDLWKLRELALTDGGLVNDTLRKRAWPKLVGLQKYETSSSAATTIPDAASIIQETTTTTNKPETTASPYSTTTTTTTTSSRYNNNLNARTLIHSTTIDEEDQQRFEIDTALVPDADAADKDKENTTALSSSSPPSGAYSILGNTTGTTPYQTHTSYADLLVQSMDVEQIERDVSRCTWHLLTGSQRSRRNQIKLKDSPSNKKVALLLKKKQRRLANLINLTLVESYAESTSSKDSNNNNNNNHKTDIDEDDKLRYYQGYHDVACIFMHALGGGQSSSASSVLSRSSLSTAFTNSSSNKNKDKDKDDPFGLDLASRVLCQVSFSHFRDSMRSNFVSLQTALKLTLYPLLAQLDPQVHNHLKDVDMEPFFCLSWVLTWFSHDVRDTNLCKRLFDAFLSSHPLLVLYVSLAMMLHPYNRQLILDTDCDFAALHQCLASLPRNSCKVGWKRASWEQGGGYISDDDEDDDGDGDDDEMDDEDDQTASTDMDTCSSVLQPPSVQTSTPSVYSASSSVFSNSNKKNNQLLLLGQTTIEEGKEQRVPFQELIDTALQYMARYPPRSLEAYARRYYERQQQQQQQDTTGMMFSPPPLSTATSGISLLQEPPTWSLISMSPSDWVLKQRLRQEMGLKATSRKDRRKKAKALSSSLSKEDETAAAAALAQALDVLDESSSSSSTFSKPDYEYLKRHANDRAVIAAGYGPGPEAILERKRKRRRLATAVAVGFLAMTVGLAIQHYGTSSTTTTTEPGTTNNIASSRSQNKANFVKSLLHPHRPETTSSLTSAAASTASGAAAILSTSAASAATTTSSTDTIASVADYCKSPMTCVLNNQSTQAEYEEEEEVKSKKKNEANEGSTITATTSSKASSSSLHRPRQVTLGGGSTQPPIAARPAEWNVSSKSSLPPPGTSSSTLTTLSSSSNNNNNNSHSRILTTRTYSSFFLWGGKMVERWTLKLLRLFLQPLRWILSGMGGRKSNNKSNTKSNSNKTIKTGHRVVLGNLWAWLDQKVDSSLALLD